MIRKKIETFSIDKIRTLLRGASSTSHAVSDFEVCIFSDTLPCFASVGLRVLKCSNDEYLSQFLSDCKVLWMTFEQLVETFIKLPIFDSSRAICVCPGGKINFWSHLDEERPKHIENPIGLLPAVTLNRLKAQAKDLRKLH